MSSSVKPIENKILLSVFEFKTTGKLFWRWQKKCNQIIRARGDDDKYKALNFRKEKNLNSSKLSINRRLFC